MELTTVTRNLFHIEDFKISKIKIKHWHCGIQNSISDSFELLDMINGYLVEVGSEKGFLPIQVSSTFSLSTAVMSSKIDMNILNANSSLNYEMFSKFLKG